MNVFHYELRALRIKTVLWICGIVAMAALYLSVYPAFSKDADTLRNIFNNLPPAMSQIMGVGQMKLFTFMGFFGNVFPIITLVGAIQAASLGLSIVSKESALGMNDFLLTKPQTRGRIFWQKLAAGVVALITTQVIASITSFFIAKSTGAGDFSLREFLMFWGAFSLIQFFMFSLGLAVSQAVRKLKATAPYALGLSFGLFLLSVLGVLIGDDMIRWLTPFRFVDYRQIVMEGTYSPEHILYGFVLSLVFMAVSYLI